MTTPPIAAYVPLLVELLRTRGIPTAPPILREGPDPDTLELSRTLERATHLDVDALDRRLRALIAGDPVAARHVHYEMDFSDAFPADPESEAHLDLQEEWGGVRPTLHVAVRGAPPRPELEALADLCRRFYLALLPRGGAPS